jgi:hypothetical protein
MADTLDALLIGAGAYYATTKLKDSDNEFNRMLIGTAVGVPAALKGPEAYEAARDYITGDSDVALETKNRVKSSLLFGAGGYALGDRILGEDDYQRDDDG